MIISMKNKYICRFVSKKKFHEILRYFVLDIEAVKISKLVGISKNSIGKIFKQIRILMVAECEKNSYSISIKILELKIFPIKFKNFQLILIFLQLFF